MSEQEQPIISVQSKDGKEVDVALAELIKDHIRYKLAWRRRNLRELNDMASSVLNEELNKLVKENIRD